MAGRSRSESPLVGDVAYEYPHSRSPMSYQVSDMGDVGDVGYESCDGMSNFGTSGKHVNPLYQATIARKRAEQDSILLANRLRMLRKEEEMTKRKIADTEKKTKEIFDVRRRNEERRLYKELEDAKREQEEQMLRERQLREKADTEKKIHEKQRSIADRKATMSQAVRQQREANLQAIQEQTEAAEREVWARAERVRRDMAAQGRSRARSEGAKQEAARNMHYDKIVREEEMRQARVSEIERMEREEAQLIARLAQSQERHRAAYMQLEDAINQNGSGGGMSTSSRGTGANTPLSVEDCYGPGAASRAAANAEIARAAAGRGAAAPVAARPPRPRGPPLERGPSSSATPVGSHARSSSAGKGRREGSRFGALSSCSTASGEQDASRAQSNASTPTGSLAAMGGGAPPAAAGKSESPKADAAKGEDAQPLKYTTVDGTTLEIPEEEDLDLASLLCA